MDVSLERIFESLAPPPAPEGRHPAYSVAPLRQAPEYFVGKDTEGKACILIKIAHRDSRHQAPIQLESLEVQFEVLSLVRTGIATREDVFTVIRCRSTESEIIRYFLSVCKTIIGILGTKPTRTAVANAVNRLALIFQRLQNPPSRPVNGLFGELFLIRQSRSPLRALAAWRTQDVSRFDFSAGDIRLDVKTATGRVRAHNFSYEQCNPPPGTIGIAASLFVERAAGGTSLGEIISDIDRLSISSTDLVMKLHMIVAATLGMTAREALGIRFDLRLAESSLQFYDLRSIPAIRGEAPPSVSDIHFRSDLSSVMPASLVNLAEQDPALADLLPPRAVR